MGRRSLSSERRLIATLVTSRRQRPVLLCRETLPENANRWIISPRILGNDYRLALFRGGSEPASPELDDPGWLSGECMDSRPALSINIGSTALLAAHHNPKLYR